jgi:hypothetical protein
MWLQRTRQRDDANAGVRVECVGVTGMSGGKPREDRTRWSMTTRTSDSATSNRNCNNAPHDHVPTLQPLASPIRTECASKTAGAAECGRKLQSEELHDLHFP